MSFAHILHAAHPVVDSLLCKNGTKIVVSPTGYGEYLNGREVGRGTELGHDCSGTPSGTRGEIALKERPGLYNAVSDDGRMKWPKVSKSSEWNVDNGGDLYTNWGRTEVERHQWMFPSVKYDREKHSQHNMQNGRLVERTWWRKYMLAGRKAWLLAHPTWWDEKRRAAEVDASAQVAGEMTDMNLDNKAIVAGHLAHILRGCTRAWASVSPRRHIVGLCACGKDGLDLYHMLFQLIK